LELRPQPRKRSAALLEISCRVCALALGSFGGRERGSLDVAGARGGRGPVLRAARSYLNFFGITRCSTSLRAAKLLPLFFGALAGLCGPLAASVKLLPRIRSQAGHTFDSCGRAV
jgi:hypothetical protein